MARVDNGTNNVGPKAFQDDPSTRGEYEMQQLLHPPEVASDQKNGTVIEGWPTKPQPTRRWTAATAVGLCWDLLLTLTPLVFLVFAICALASDKKELSGLGTNVRRAANLGPTIFPIIFAALVARFMRGFATFRAERGTRLGLLEQLIGSQSLGGTMERALLLRRCDAVGVTIVLLWLLSPLGGQSSLRILDIASHTVTSQGSISYFTATPATQMSSVFVDGHDTGIQTQFVGSLLQASLLESDDVRNSPVDLWNNVKIPRLEVLSPFANQDDGNAWTATNITTRPTTWSSLSGLMVKGLPKDGNSTFVLESSYIDFSCLGDAPVDETGLNDLNNSLPTTGKLPDFETPGLGINGGRPEMTSSVLVILSPIHNTSDFEPIDTPVNVLYVSRSSEIEKSNPDPSIKFDVFNCSLAPTMVESNVTCLGSLCAVTSMRRSTPSSAAKTPFAVQELSNIFNALPVIAAKPPNSGQPVVLDVYLLGKDAPLQVTYQQASNLPAFPSVSGSRLAQRLTTFFNTVWQASLAPNDIAFGSAFNLTSSAPGTSDWTIPTVNALTTIAREVPIYSANISFIVILLIITLILQLVAVTGLILKYTANAPDILGYVSTMTRENPYTNVPSGGNALDGLQRARLLAGMHVQLADVSKDQDLGYLVLKSVENRAESAEGRPEKKRLYA